MKLIKDINFLIVGLGLLGGSYAKGLKNIGFNVSAITKNQDDIDFAIENKIIDKGTTEIDPKIIGEADVVVGSRYVKGVNVVDWPMRRLLLSYCASRYVRCVTRMPVRDATAGFVGYRAEVLQTINLDEIRMKGYGFQIEMKYTAWRLGFRIKELSIIFRDRTAGTSKMSGSIFGEAFWGVMGLRLRRIKRV